MTREALHRLIDQLPESQIAPAAALIEAASNHDHALIQALLAEEEPMEDGDIEALAEVDRTNLVSSEEVDRIFGVT